MKSFLPLILLLFAANISMRAQTTGMLSGRVMDQKKKPIGGAMIVVLGTSPLRGTVTGNGGSFSAGRIQAGIYRTLITAVGYHDRLDSVRIEADHETRWDFTLTPNNIDTFRVIIPEENLLEWQKSRKSQHYSTIPQLIPNDNRMRNKTGMVVIGKSGNHLSRTNQSTFTNIQQAIAHAGGINTIGQNCCGLFRPPRITYVPYRMPEEGRRLTVGFQIRGTRGGTDIRIDGVEVSDPFQGGFWVTNTGYYPTYSIVSKYPEAENSRSTGGFEPEYGDVVDIRPEEIGTNAITPSEYYRATGGNPYNVTDSPLTSLMQSLNDPSSADGRFHRRGSFPRRRSSIFH
ncbi:MAG: carboxypeptidase-like regulatory domain-containing protein [Bacteroidota bacterium]